MSCQAPIPNVLNYDSLPHTYEGVMHRQLVGQISTLRDMDDAAAMDKAKTIASKIEGLKTANISKQLQNFATANGASASQIKNDFIQDLSTQLSKITSLCAKKRTPSPHHIIIINTCADILTKIANPTEKNLEDRARAMSQRIKAFKMLPNSPEMDAPNSKVSTVDQLATQLTEMFMHTEAQKMISDQKAKTVAEIT